MIARVNDECFEGGESVEREVETFGEGRRLFAEDAAQRFAFNAEDFDTDTPLTYNDARWHDPTTGQFLSTDPMEHDTQNHYRYVSTNPQNLTDPTGL